MPPAALLCQLVWRAGMLAARVTCLMLFARVFNWWVCGVAGEQDAELCMIIRQGLVLVWGVLVICTREVK